MSSAPRNHRAHHLGRRAFLARLAVGGSAAACGWSADLWTPARAAATRGTLARVARPAGTTLEASIRKPEAAPGEYVRLVEGPPYPIVVRDELHEPGDRHGDVDAATVLAAVVHLTDIHIIDAQSTTRVEFFDRFSDPFTSAQRCQEALTVHVATSMVHRVNAVAAGPVTGRRFDCAVSTGDNIDNQQQNELEWLLGVLDGGAVTPNSGAPDRYEGVQDGEPFFYDANYWHPGPPPDGHAEDFYKTSHGFPELPDLLDAAIAPLTSPGLEVPWYCVFGNHDGLTQGTGPNGVTEPTDLRPFEAIALGPAKVMAPPQAMDPREGGAWFEADPQGAIRAVLTNPGALRPVTADPKRHYISRAEWIEAHLRSPADPGPVGHGYGAEMLDTKRLDFVFDVSPAVVGIGLDTVGHAGYSEGSVGTEQLRWLEARLVEAHSRHFDAAGSEVRTDHADRLVVLFSHHNLYTMGNPFPDPLFPEEQRVGFDPLRELLSRFPNVIAWVNGHSHVNRVTPVSDPSGRTGGFWEVSTAAHVDYPEHARVLEIVDNRDGTLSIFCTILEHAAPPTADPGDRSVLGLAAVSRELAANDPQHAPGEGLGGPGDLNVELLIKAPFPVASVLGVLEERGASTGGGDAAVSGRPTPATGGVLSLPLAAGLAALGGAVALRRRTEQIANQPD